MTTQDPNNPYQAPAANVDASAATSDNVWAFNDPQKVPAGRGWGWITEGWKLFTKNPLIWIVNVVIFFLIMIILSVIPIISLVANIIQPIFTGGLMRGAHTLDTEGNLEVGHLFAGFNEKGGKLAIVGLLNLVAFMIFGAIIGIFFIGALGTASGGQDGLFTGIMLLLIPVAVIVAILVTMLFLFAPSLIILHDLDVFQAIKMSFIGCIRNIFPLIVYGIIAVVLSVIAAIPVFLGFLVLVPVMVAAMYVAWKDIYTNA